MVPVAERVRTDATLLRDLEANATGNPRVARIAIAYTLLTAPRSAEDVRAELERLPEPGGPDSITALWRGRAAWTLGSKDVAVRHWQLAFGSQPMARKRLAEALYLAGDVFLAVDEVTAFLFLPDCQRQCRQDAVEMLRYWIVWQGSALGVPILCDRMLGRIRPDGDALTVGMANILATRAQSFGQPSAEAEANLAHAERLHNTPYVRAVRAFFVLRGGDRELAVERARSVVPDAAGDGHALIMAAVTMLQGGDRAGGRRACVLVLERDPLLSGIAQSLLDAYPDTTYPR